MMAHTHTITALSCWRIRFCYDVTWRLENDFLRLSDSVFHPQFWLGWEGGLACQSSLL